uniref:ANF_receptor domain-containing protein n=1 Tax=Globodera pallida TaxID=36090 RepID=A0A183CSS0_GLOPA
LNGSFIDVKELSKHCMAVAESESPALQIAYGTLPSTSSVAVAVADNPLLVRHSARQVANASIRSQTDTSLAWGCIGDFARPYLTMHSAYVGRQLELFVRMFEFLERGCRKKYLLTKYIVASALVPHISKEFGFDIAVLGTVSGAQLADNKIFYKIAWANVQALPVFVCQPNNQHQCV